MMWRAEKAPSSPQIKKAEHCNYRLPASSKVAATLSNSRGFSSNKAYMFLLTMSVSSVAIWCSTEWFCQLVHVNDALFCVMFKQAFADMQASDS